MKESVGPVWGKDLEGPRIFRKCTAYVLHLSTAYMHCGVHCAAALRQSRSVAARAWATIQALAELEQWRAAAGAGCRNGDGLLGQRSIGNNHAVGNG